jgi:hypothetical protein
MTISKALKQNNNNIEKRKEKELIDRVNFFLISACVFLSAHLSTSINSIQKQVNVLKGNYWIIKCHQSFMSRPNHENRIYHVVHNVEFAWNFGLCYKEELKR